jgi:hypothetical protein
MLGFRGTDRNNSDHVEQTRAQVAADSSSGTQTADRPSPRSQATSTAVNKEKAEEDERLAKEKADIQKAALDLEKKRQDAAREKTRRDAEEKDAQTLLLFAKDLVSSKKSDAAIERLEKILDKYPAREAKEILAKLKK